MVRVISQIGDSTDGEDYDELPGDVNTLPKKQDLLKKMNEYKYKHKYKDASTRAEQELDLNISCILKEIGNQLLQSKEVRTEYKNIKSAFIPQNIKNQIDTLDNKLGRGWGLIVNYYDLIKNKMLEGAASDYFKINEEKIKGTCGAERDYQNLNNNAERGEYYLKKKVSIDNACKNIYKLHKTIESHTQDHRKIVEPLLVEPSLSTNHPTDASLFLAKIKASKKLDKDLGKNHLYDYKYGTGKVISNTAITRKTTQQNETLEICKKGAFKHFKTNEGTYSKIGEEWKKLIDGQHINANVLREFFQSSLKGVLCNSIIKKTTEKTDLIDQLKTDVELIFGIEVKRNPAALLTNAMFFDLVDAGRYKIEDIATKMPMAMQGAVSASVIIDKVMGKSIYDYRDNLRGSEEVLELVKKDESILQDWLNLELNISSKIERSDTTNAIPSLGMNDLVKKLADLKLGYIDTSKCSTRKKIQNEENIGFRFDDCSGIVKLQWDTAVGKFKVSESQIHDVKAKVFYDLILEWYGIKLPYLNKSDKITLKAAAEPKDLEDNQDEGNSKVLAIDEGKLAPETELSEYKQEDYILYKDNFDTVLQHEHAFVQPLGEIVAIS